MLHQRLHDPSLSRTELAFLDALSPVFTELEESAAGRRCTSRAPRGCSRSTGFGDVSELNALMDMLERRVALLEVLRSALGRPRRARSGSAPRTRRPALRSLALVAASYGLPQRSLGTVSVIGPLRMDYGARDPRRPRGRARSSRRFVADVYDER